MANLTVERYDHSSVVIKRADSTGAAAGLAAAYTGTRHGERVGGFTSSWPGHWDNKSGNWYAILERDSVTPPSVMHWCTNSGNCFTLTMENGHHVAYDNGKRQGSSIRTIESFKRDSVVIRRTEPTATAMVTGKISPEGTSIVDGTISWIGMDVHGTFRAAWGAALGTVPGSNNERDRANGTPAPSTVMVPIVPVMPSVCFPWFFGIVCG